MTEHHPTGRPAPRQACALCGEAILTTPGVLELPDMLPGPVPCCGACGPAGERFANSRRLDDLPDGPLRQQLQFTLEVRSALGLAAAVAWLWERGGSLEFAPGHGGRPPSVAAKAYLPDEPGQLRRAHSFGAANPVDAIAGLRRVLEPQGEVADEGSSPAPGGR